MNTIPAIKNIDSKINYAIGVMDYLVQSGELAGASKVMHDVVVLRAARRSAARAKQIDIRARRSLTSHHTSPARTLPRGGLEGVEAPWKPGTT
jgi:hypothetical protein